MAVLEIQSRPAHRDVRWTEVCATDHSPVGQRVAHAQVGLRSTSRVLERDDRVSTRSIAPGRRVPVRPVSGAGVRACRPGGTAPAGTTVIDDVPTWVLLAVGLVVAVIMLLALALVGGPTYA